MSLNDLSTAPVKDEVDFTNMPEQMGGFAPPPQPGSYRFALSPLKSDNFDVVDGKDYGPRAKVMFNDDAPLVIVQALDPALVNTPFRTTLTNVPRKRGKGADAPIASDWDYLNRALGETTRPASPRAYADALIAKSNTRAQFSADVEWSWSCNPGKAAQFIAEDGSLVPVKDASGADQMGCGARYYQKDVSALKVDGVFPERIQCPKCMASVRAFANLTRFKA